MAAVSNEQLSNEQVSNDALTNAQKTRGVRGATGQDGCMTVMRQMVWADMTASDRGQLMHRGLDTVFADDLKASIGEIIKDVKAHGDRAVRDALARFDKIDVAHDQLRISKDERAAADSQLPAAVHHAIEDAITHIRTFNEQQRSHMTNWRHESEPGLMVGEKLTPIRSAGLFCPSGKASYPSVLTQLATPALVAGVPTIVTVVPPVPGGAGEVDPAVLVVANQLGLEHIFRANGPAGIAAMAFGTESIPKVVKIVGPGSPAVTCAQVEVQRWGTSTMMILGPSESMIVADDHADPLRLAWDLMIEAEHGDDSSVVLVTTSASLAAAVDVEIERCLAKLPANRANAVRAAVGVNGGCVIVDNIDIATDVANEYGPEHLQVATVDPEATLQRLHCAGEILLGQHTPFSAANFIIGCPASLPTSGFASVSSGITVSAFMKRTAIARADEAALRRMTPSVLALADHEGFPAHSAALRYRAAQP
jgi:histidinol dehydrogenase